MGWMNRQPVLLTLLGLLVAGVLIPYSPMFEEVPSTDSGVFLYIGEQILNGAIPYRDVWDHKPPAIYYINALGLFIGRGSVWGVWLLELSSLYVAAGLGFILFKRAFGIMPAIFGSIAWLASLVFVLDSGNYTEEFALPFQFTALYLFCQSEKQDSYSWRGFLIGVTSAVSFLLRPNLVGVQLSIIIVVLLTRVLSRRWHSLWIHLTWICFGAISIISIVVIYFAAHGALGSLLDQVFRYNFTYSATTLGDQIDSILAGYKTLSSTGISTVALIAWIVSMVYMRYAGDQMENGKPLLYVSLVGLPVEFFLASISGRSYVHYYIAWLPVFAILMSLFAYAFATSVAPRLKNIIRIGKVTSAAIWLFAIFLMSFQPVQKLFMRTGTVARAEMRQMIEYIKNFTEESDYVLIWGNDTRINFAAKRQAPTRFVYQQALYTRGYQTPEMIDEFLCEIMMNQPVLIIDTSPSDVLIPPIDHIKRESWAPSSLYDYAYRPLPEMYAVFQYLASNYTFIGTIGQREWRVYMYVGKEPG